VADRPDTTEAPELSAWVETINAELGTSFALDDAGGLFIELEGGLKIGVDFPEGAGEYTIYAPIGALDEAAQLPRLLTALQLNLYQRGTAGGVIGLDMMSGLFVYSFNWPVARSSPQLLAAQLDAFAGHAEQLRAELEAVVTDPEHAELALFAADNGLFSEPEADAFESADDGRLDAPGETPPGGPGGGIRV
jgi:hypothetical protein